MTLSSLQASRSMFRLPVPHSSSSALWLTRLPSVELVSASQLPTPFQYQLLELCKHTSVCESQLDDGDVHNRRPLSALNWEGGICHNHDESIDSGKDSHALLDWQPVPAQHKVYVRNGDVEPIIVVFSQHGPYHSFGSGSLSFEKDKYQPTSTMMTLNPGQKSSFPLWESWRTEGVVTVYMSNKEKACLEKQPLDEGTLGVFDRRGTQRSWWVQGAF